MPAAPSSLFYGLSAWFIDLLLTAEPDLEHAVNWNSPSNPRRDMDFVEVFSGCGHLSFELLRANWLHYYTRMLSSIFASSFAC